MSALAVVALLSACLCSPCLLVPLSNWINWYVPQAFNQTGKYGFLHFWLRIAAMAVATGLSLVAHLRIKHARGALRGETLAQGALAISVFWWALMLAVFLFWVIAIALSR